jgi:hypothetical protein
MSKNKIKVGDEVYSFDTNVAPVGVGLVGVVRKVEEGNFDGYPYWVNFGRGLEVWSAVVPVTPLLRALA